MLIVKKDMLVYPTLAQCKAKVDSTWDQQGMWVFRCLVFQMLITRAKIYEIIQNIKITVSWNAISCSFGRCVRLHLQSVTWHFSTLKIGVGVSFETLISTLQNTKWHNLNIHCSKNLKPHLQCRYPLRRSASSSVPAVWHEWSLCSSITTMCVHQCKVTKRGCLI
jgi:hypothetical protein